MIDPVLEAAEGGTGPRPRRLDSMIAGRRRVADEDAGTSSSRSKSADDEAKPASSRSAAKSDDGNDEERPRVRRTRRGGGGSSSGSGTRRAADSADAPKRDEKREEQEPAAESKPATRSTSRSSASESRDEDEEKAAPRARTRRSTTSSSASEDVTELREAVARQEQMLGELRDGITALGERITVSGYRPRIGIFVDVPNLIYGYEGDGSVHMGKLLKLLTDGRDLVRATAYSPVSDDPREPMEQQRFVAPFVPFEYRIVTKPLKRFADGSIKGNFDVEMAIDMVLMADRVDVMAIVSGDADFARAVEAVQQKGVRVEVVAFSGSTSIEMRALADHYLELGRVVDKIT